MAAFEQLAVLLLDRRILREVALALDDFLEADAMRHAEHLILINRHSEGVEVVVRSRPDALKLRPISPGAAAAAPAAGAARVMAARLLGRTSLVHLSIDGAGGEPVHLHARIPGRFLPVEDEVMAIHLDRSEAFVFPVGNAK